MNKLNNIEQAQFEEVSKNVGKILIATMDALDIPNFIEATYSCNGNDYKLKFDKIDKK
jgi:hypothetical protein